MLFPEVDKLHGRECLARFVRKVEYQYPLLHYPLPLGIDHDTASQGGGDDHIGGVDGVLKGVGMD